MTLEQARRALEKHSIVYRQGEMESDFYIVCITGLISKGSEELTARLTNGEEYADVDIRHLSLFPSGQLTYDLNVPELIISKEARQRLVHRMLDPKIWEMPKDVADREKQRILDNFKKQKEMEQQKSSYTAEQFAIMNRLDGKEVKDTITGFTGKVTGFAVYPEYEGKYVNVMIGKQTDTGDFIERWIWNTRLVVIE